jgi:CDP-glucose 4,6-dehydratase
VIGGGDFASDRIIPDCIRAAIKNERIPVRNPYSIRPYQHVLEALFAYLLIANEQIGNAQLAGCYNVGPDDKDCVETQTLVSLFCDCWQDEAFWETESNNEFKEATFLKLDCSLIKSALGWSPKWSIADAVNKTVEWTKGWMQGDNPLDIMIRQIQEYRALR